MRILHVIPNLLKGGAERIALNICNEINAQNEHEVLLITFQPDNAYSFLTKNLNWKIIPSDVVPSISGKNHINVSELQKAIEEYRPDTIHAHLFKSIMVLSQIRFDSAKYFFHFHDKMHQFSNFSWSGIARKSMWTNLFEKRFVLRAYADRKVIALAISSSTFAYAINVLPKLIKVELLLNAIDYKRFYIELPRPSNNKLVMIGSLVPKKNQLLAIQTVRELHSRGLSTTLDLIGSGPMRTQLDQFVDENNLNEHVKFHGSVDHPEHILQQASIYLHTARVEAFGLVLVEAMAAGLPVVCTNGGGNRDLIEQSLNGFIVDDFTPTLLADKIEFLIMNPEEKSKMSKYAQEFSSHFDIPHYVAVLIGLYKKS